MARLRRAALAGALAAFIVFAGALPAVAATVTGRVLMGTEDGELPDDLQVMVLQIPADGEPTDPTPATVTEGGAFEFEAAEGLSHVVGTFHREIPYSVVVPPDTESVDLTIYETTEDPSVISVVSDAITVVRGAEEGSNVLEVLQLLRIDNSSDRTYVGPGDDSGRVITLPVPESAYDLSPASQSNPAGLATDGPEVVATTPLLPGETSIPYLYRVSVPRTGWQLRREVLLPTARTDLLIGPNLVFNAGPGFEFEEETDLGGQTYRRYRRVDLTPGSVVAADIGFPGESGAGVWIGAVGVLGVLAALLAAAAGLRRKRRKAAADLDRTDDKTDDDSSRPTRAELVEQIARLDEDHAAGKISSEEHGAEREALLAEVQEASDGKTD